MNRRLACLLIAVATLPTLGDGRAAPRVERERFTGPRPSAIIEGPDAFGVRRGPAPVTPPLPQLVPGACCVFDDCIPVDDEAACGALGGVFLEGADCAMSPCGPGACCSDVGCNIATAYDCITAGRDFYGAGTDCLSDPCAIGFGACCVSGACLILPEVDCVAAGGTWLGGGTTCFNEPCVIGACCLPGDCIDLPRFACEDLGGVFTPDVSCADGGCEIENDCPADSLLAQRRSPPNAFTAYTSEVASGLQRWDRYQGAAGAIDAVRWWGLELELTPDGFVPCADPFASFIISFHPDLAGLPGEATCAEAVVASRIDTGLNYLGITLYQYEAVLTTPCVLPTGWISIVGDGDPTCWFLWMSSNEGDGVSLCDGCQSFLQYSDLSFCLIGQAGGIVGACCNLTSGTCVDDVDIADCLAPGTYFEPGATCADLDPPCAPTTGACCRPDGSCSIELPETCVAMGGAWLGADSTCDLCPPVGACCLGPGECALLTEAECNEPTTVWLGPGTDCGDCPDVPECPPDALFGQSPDGPDDFIAGTSEVASPFRRYEDFTGVTGAIDALTWWGLDLEPIPGTNNFIECVEVDPTFEISFHADAGGVPGEAICSYVLTATRTPLALLYLGAEFNEYTVTLPEPCAITNGWVSIAGVGDPTCWFLWMSAGLGDSYCTGCIPGPQDFDLAVCLHGTSGGITGACCTDATGECLDGVDIADCASPDQRFVPGATCARLDPPCGTIIGACCFADAGCDITTEADCTALGGDWLGASTTCAQCPCIVPCPPGASTEGETPCAPEYFDDFNGGCVAALPRFSEIAVGETVCGESGVFPVNGEKTPDFDWYEVVITEPSVLSWTGTAMFEEGLWIVDGNDGCPGNVLASAAALPCSTITITATVGPGTYWLVIAPIAFSDAAFCPSPYVVTLSRGEPCPADLDADGAVGPADLASLLASWGPCPGCTADLDGSGDVGPPDLAALLAAWGECP